MWPRSDSKESAADDLYALHNTVKEFQPRRHRMFHLLNIIPDTAQKIRLVKSMLNVGLGGERP